MRQLSFKRHRFPPDIIRHAIWLYARFTLSFRDVEELLAERGLDISYETIRCWFLKFGTVIAANLRRTRPKQEAGLRAKQDRDGQTSILPFSFPSDRPCGRTRSRSEGQ
jgi:transposase-like protein